MSKRNSYHWKALEKIVSNPCMFGFEKIISASTEVNLFDHRGKIVAQPDVILRSVKGVVYLIEYKSNGDGEMTKRAKEQLQRAVWWYGKYTGLPHDKIETRIISGTDSRYKYIFRGR